jgi:uncharacterized protein DUF4235
MKILFLPFSILAGLIAGFLSKKLFEAIWGLFDDEEAPEAQHREVSVLKLALALLIEGAIFRAVRGLVDHEARKRFHGVTGTWPGEEAPERS